MISPIYDIPDHIDYGSEKTKNDNPHSLKIKDDDDEDNDIESANHLKKNGKSNKLEIEQIKKVYVSDNVPDKVKWEYVVRIINKKVQAANNNNDPVENDLDAQGNQIFDELKDVEHEFKTNEEAGYEKVYNLIMISFLWKQI